MSEQGSECAGLREILHRPDPVYGAFLSIPDPGVAAILGWSGFDFVLIDAEHGPFTLSSARHCVDALASTPAKVAIRVPGDDPVLLKGALDLGVDGVMVPKLSDAAATAAVVSACRYPPEGSRGVGSGHATRYGSDSGEYLADANRRVAVLAIVEDGAGVEDAAEIAAVEGLDAIVIGPTDLAADLGLLGESGHQRVREAIARVLAAGVEAGVKVGTGCDPEEVAELRRNGMGLFFCFFDGPALGTAARAAAAAARGSRAQR